MPVPELVSAAMDVFLELWGGKLVGQGHIGLRVIEPLLLSRKRRSTPVASKPRSLLSKTRLQGFLKSRTLLPAQGCGMGGRDARLASLQDHVVAAQSNEN